MREEFHIPTYAEVHGIDVTVREPRGQYAAPGPERVICSAIYVDTKKWEGRTYNYPATGLVFCGWRHPDCYVSLFAWANSLSPEARALVDEEEIHGKYDGFLTSRGRFVSRSEAARIAVAAKQVPPDVDWLQSEHLY